MATRVNVCRSSTDPQRWSVPSLPPPPLLHPPLPSRHRWKRFSVNPFSITFDSPCPPHSSLLQCIKPGRPGRPSWRHPVCQDRLSDKGEGGGGTSCVATSSIAAPTFNSRTYPILPAVVARWPHQLLVLTIRSSTQYPRFLHKQLWMCLQVGLSLKCTCAF